jgi:N-acetyl-gamma-glutamyl-phosphate reductase
MMRIFIDGAAGTTGIEIEARLADRAEFELLRLDDAQRKDSAARRDALNAADVAVLCLPDDAAREAVALIDNTTTRIIDASTAHRTAKGWTYGFPEIGNNIASAMRVSNPGCYATGFVSLIAPLVQARRIGPGAPIMCNAVSGYSGGGRTMIAEYEGPNPPAWRTYALGMAHKHVPEMQLRCGLTNPPLFAPSVANTYRGMIVDVPLFGANPKAIRETLAEFYADSPIVKLRELNDDTLTIEHAAWTDRLDLFVFSNGSQTRLTAAFDNLGKGASGAAVQCLNLMAGLPETTGLRL